MNHTIQWICISSQRFSWNHSKKTWESIMHYDGYWIGFHQGRKESMAFHGETKDYGLCATTNTQLKHFRSHRNQKYMVWWIYSIIESYHSMDLYQFTRFSWNQCNKTKESIMHNDGYWIGFHQGRKESMAFNWNILGHIGIKSIWFDGYIIQ